MSEENKKLVRRITEEVWSKRDLSLGCRLSAIDRKLLAVSRQDSRGQQVNRSAGRQTRGQPVLTAKNL